MTKTEKEVTKGYIINGSNILPSSLRNTSRIMQAAVRQEKSMREKIDELIVEIGTGKRQITQSIPSS